MILRINAPSKLTSFHFCSEINIYQECLKLIEVILVLEELMNNGTRVYKYFA